MTSPNNEPEKGRVLVVKQGFPSSAITAAEFSVLVSDGLYTQEDGTRMGSRQTKRYGEMYFYADYNDAMEESAFLVGMRVGEPPEVAAARRARSNQGKTFILDTSQMGRMGIGLKAGVINSAGTRFGAVTTVNVTEKEACALAIAAVDMLKPSHMGTVIEKFVFTDTNGDMSIRRARVIAERPDGGVTMTVMDDQGAQVGTSVFRASTALALLGAPSDPIGSEVTGDDWPLLAKLTKAVHPTSVWAADGGERMLSRDAMRLLAAVGVASAEDIAKIPSLDDTDAAEMIVGWFREFAEKLKPMARRDASGAASDGLDGIIAGAQANCAVGEPLHERHIAQAMQTALGNLSKTGPGLGGPTLGQDRALAAAQMLVTPRHLDLSGGSRTTFQTPAAATAPAAAPAVAAAPAATPSVVQQPGGIPTAHVFATAFFKAALSEEEFDLFIRNSSMYTLDAILRLALLNDVRGSRVTLAAALEAKLAQTACDVVSVTAMLGTGRTSTQLLDTFRALVESGRATAGAAPAAAPAAAPLVVRIGDTELPEGDERPEAVALSRDVSEVAGSQPMRARLKALGGMIGDVNMLFSATTGPETGAQLRRMLETPQETMLSKALVRHQMPDDLVQIIQLARAALGSGDRMLLIIYQYDYQCYDYF